MEKNNRIKIVADTNVLLVSISEYSKHHWFYQGLINKEFDLYITSEILMEYEEVISLRWRADVAHTTVQTLLELSNVFQTVPFFRLNLINTDPDDNKFVDCAFANNVHYLVSNDKHMEVLKHIPFPAINILKLDEFALILKKTNS